MAHANSTPLLNKRLTALSVLALIGVVVSIWNTQHYYDLHSGATGFKSFCNISSSMNCDVVAASPYANFFGIAPLSSFVTGWFLAILILSLLARDPENRRENSTYLLAMTGFGTLMSLAYLVIMAAVLKSFCLLCLVTDLLNFACLGVAWSVFAPSRATGAPGFRGFKTAAAVVAGSLLVMIVALKGMDKLSLKQSEIDSMVDEIMTTTPVAVNASEEFPSFGAKNATVTIVEFVDFQCPSCRMGATTLSSVLKLYPETLRLVVRMYPLSPDCNPQVERMVHPAACEAAKIALCAHKQGKMKETYESLFQNQSDLAPGKVLEQVKDVGLDSAQLQACTGSPDINLQILRDTEEGKQLGVQSTPTFFINGRKVMGARPIEVWTRVIDSLGGKK